MTVSASLIVASVCCVLSVAFRIDLEVGDVTIGAAFAPVLVIVSHEARTNVVLVAAAVGALCFAVVTLRRGALVALREVGALALSLVVFVEAASGAAVFGASGKSSLGVLLGGAAAVSTYSVVADAMKHLVGWDVPREDRRVWLLLQAVLISAYGLMAQVYGQIGWPAIAVMLVLLAITKSEFDRYAKARRTLAQTVRALHDLDAASLP